MVTEPIMLDKHQISSYNLCSNMLSVRENTEVVTASSLKTLAFYPLLLLTAAHMKVSPKGSLIYSLTQQLVGVPLVPQAMRV